MQGEESQRVEIGEGEMEWVWNGPDSTIVISKSLGIGSLTIPDWYQTANGGTD